MSRKKLRIATRKSPLALWQAEHIAKSLLQLDPTLDIELVKLSTSGDRFLKDKLLTVGGKGLFVKELEEALLTNRADLAVHSMKDMPNTCPPGLMIAAISERENPYDAFISVKHTTFNTLPLGARIGTSSLRRQSQLLAIRKDLQMLTLRGNIHTRLEKLQKENYDAIILAVAGLSRMNLMQHIREILPEDIMLPSCGQGALGIECRSGDVALQALIAPLNDPKTALCVTIERDVNALLGGNCHVPLAVHATWIDDAQMLLQARVASANGQILIKNCQQGPVAEAKSLASACAQQLLAEGAKKLLQENTI